MPAKDVNRLLIVFIASLFYIIALTPRIVQIVPQDPQGDELMWNRRSSILLFELQSGHFSQTTSHLGHPGIPPALAMALAKFVNQNILPSDLQTDDLGAARIGNALLSALIGPATFLMFLCILGTSSLAFSLSIGSALFVSLDPQHVAISRLAHVDAALSVFTTLTACLFLKSEFSGKQNLKLLAGICWGLSLACKPTALVLMPTFFLFKILRAFSARKEQLKPAILSWSDIWACLIGFATLACVFTRFWQHNGPFLTVLNAVSPFADATYLWGTTLAQNYLLLAVLGLLIAVVSLVSAYRFEKMGRHIRNASFTLLTLVLVFTIVPQVFENFIRYFIRLSALAEFVKTDKGYSWKSAPFGYLGVFFQQLPLFSVVCTLLGIAWFLAEVSRKKDCLNPHAKNFFYLSGLIVVLWCLELNTSPKQMVRYMLPVLPFLYLFASFGLLRSFQLVAAYSGSSMLKHHFSKCTYGLILVCLGGLLLYLHPHYLNFFNSSAGGILGAYEEKYAFFYQGHTQALKFLHQQASGSNRPIKVAAVGDVNAMKLADLRLMARETLPANLELSLSPFVQGSEFVLVDRAAVPMFEQLFGTTLQGLVEVFEFSLQGLSAVRVYRTEYSSFETPFNFPLFSLPRGTGGTTGEDLQLGYGEKYFLYALPQRHQVGNLYFGESLKIKPGSYRVTVSAALVQGYSPVQSQYPREVLRSELGESCVVSITTEDLRTYEFRPFSTDCIFAEQTQAEIKGYWTGAGPIAIDFMQIEALSEQDAAALREAERSTP